MIVSDCVKPSVNTVKKAEQRSHNNDYKYIKTALIQEETMYKFWVYVNIVMCGTHWGIGSHK